MTTAIAERNNGAAIMERVITAGDLKNLTPEERTLYYRSVCESMNLNPLSRPFEFITLNGKLTLYARKDATDQLRQLRGVSLVGKPDIKIEDGLCIVTVMVQDASGRTDSDIGIVALDNLRGEAKANAVMKAITKAKRRATLSICGLGWLDETEVETIPGARVESNGVVVEAEPPPPPVEPRPPARRDLSVLQARLADLAAEASAIGLAVPPLPADEDGIMAAGKTLKASIAEARAVHLPEAYAAAIGVGVEITDSDRPEVGQDAAYYRGAAELWARMAQDQGADKPF